MAMGKRRGSVAWGGLLALLIGSAAGPGATASKPPKSEWVRYPEPADWTAVAPEPARRGQFARAVMRCALADSGDLEKCRITREMPAGSGVGAALLSLAPKFGRARPGPKSLREVDVPGAWTTVDRPPDWVKRPSATELRAVFPSDAYDKGISGSAIIDCIATIQGGLSECVVLDERPAGMAFGGAAIALTPQFSMRSATLKGAPVPSIVRVPINFTLFGPGLPGESKKVAPPNLPWIEAPTYADVVAAYPPKAREQRVGGRATVGCSMTREGRLTHCSTLTALPRGYGFDAAAKSLAKRFRLEVLSASDATATRNIVVHLPVTFDPSMLEQAEPVVGKPNWSALPSADALRSAFEALKMEGVLRVQLKCVIRPGGYVGDCEAISEQPAGKGLGAMALTLAPTFRVTTWTAEGLPTVGGKVVSPLRYEPGPAAASSSAK